MSAPRTRIIPSLLSPKPVQSSARASLPTLSEIRNYPKITSLWTCKPMHAFKSELGFFTLAAHRAADPLKPRRAYKIIRESRSLPSRAADPSRPRLGGTGLTPRITNRM
ncbi:hypothetical protein L1887_17737 [Cichorium endivia]|nr:hypothetical protein L1887_17737 [Cichorium endivia]